MAASSCTVLACWQLVGPLEVEAQRVCRRVLLVFECITGRFVRTEAGAVIDITPMIRHDGGMVALPNVPGAMRVAASGIRGATSTGLFKPANPLIAAQVARDLR